MNNLPLNLKSILILMSSLSTIFTGTFLVLLSVFNQDLKGIIYLSGVTLATIINYFLGKTISDGNQADNEYCHLFSTLSNGTNAPSQSSMFILFTFAYMWLPMLTSGINNYPLLMFLLGLFVIDVIVKNNGGCSHISGLMLGGLVGFLLGVAWYYLLDFNGLEKVLYFNELSSNNVVCSKPSKETFKCSVYKNGQLISSNIA